MDDTKRYERLRERYLNGDLDRRRFLGLLGAAGLAYGVQTPFARYAFAQDVSQVRFDGWGGVVSEAFRELAFDPFDRRRPASRWSTAPSAAPTNTSAGSRRASRANTTSPTCRACSTTRATPISAYSSELNRENIPNLQYVIDKLVSVLADYSGGTLSARALRLRHHRHRLQPRRDLRRGGAGEGREPADRRGLQGQDRRLGRLAHADLDGGAADRAGPQQHRGHGGGLGRDPQAPRPGAEVLDLGRRADEPAGRGRDLRHRGLVGPDLRAAGAGPRHRLRRPARTATAGRNACSCSRARRSRPARSC